MRIFAATPARACIILLPMAGVFLCMCGRKEESPVIARVGKAVLRQDDLYRSIPPEYSDRITREQVIGYVKQWVNTELLYQEAIRRKLHRDAQLRKRLERMQKDLLSAEMINRNVLADQSRRVTEEMIHGYYERNKSSFIRGKDVVRFLEIVVDDQNTAQQVRRTVTKENFLEMAVRHSTSSVPDPRTVPYVPVEGLSPGAAAAIADVRVDGIVGPIASGSRYVILQVLDKQKQGTICSIDEVRDEITAVLLTERKKNDIDRLLSELRLIQQVELNTDAIPDPAATAGALREW